MVRPSPRAVLFDLDGTLLDTAPDMAAALNQVRAENGLGPLPFDDIRPHVSNGSFALTRIGFSLPDNSPEFEQHRQRFLQIYGEHVANDTQLFPGMETVLNQIERTQKTWGIVTNKPAWLTQPLLETLDLYERPGCVISGDSTTHSKPHPEPLLKAAELLLTDTSDCLYVGDAERDVKAAIAAQMPVLVATYGYIAPDDDPLAWGSDGQITSPEGILEWL